MACRVPGGAKCAGTQTTSAARVMALFESFFFFFLHYGFNMTEDSLALTPLTLDGFSNSKEDYSVTKGVLLVIPFMDHCLFMAKGFV